MEVLKNVLIKEVDGSRLGDKVFIIDNLPKSLLYKQAIKLMVDFTTPQQNLVPEFQLDERGRKIPTGAKTDELLPGIELSQTGDGGYVFFVQNNEGKMRLADIDRYLQATMPVSERVPVRIPYSSQPGTLSASPRPLDQLPRVVLPAPVSPPSKDVQAAAPSPSSSPLVAPKQRKPMTEEQKAAARERLNKARAAKAEKKASA